MICPDANALAAIPTLRDEERAAIVDHAASCDSCRGVVYALLETAGAPPEVQVSEDPAVIDRYRIERRIGSGAMGVVYAAHDPELDRRVAVKLLRAGASADRLRREAQVLAKLTHPNVVAVHDVGVFGDTTFVAMALVDGENLRSWLTGSRTTAQILDAIVQATRGVVAAHAAGIVHRDLKPDNIFVGRAGEVLVGDFGLARSGGERGSKSSGLEDSNELTRTGTILGTPAYMAPEQTDGEASAASDQFSLCVTAWEALYGTRPFGGKTLGELAAATRGGPPAEPSRSRGVSARIHAAIRRGLAADPADRHPSVAALLAALEARRRRWPLVALAGGAAIAATVAVIATRSDDGGDALQQAIASCDAQPSPQVLSPAGRAAMTKQLAGHVHAAEIMGHVDRYAQRWTELRRDSCIAVAKRELAEPVLAATTRCLERRAATLAGAFERFAKTTPMGALVFVESLEPVDSCRDVAPGPAASPELAKLQHELDLLVVLQPSELSLSKVDLVDLVKRAEASGDPATSAQALLVVGTALHWRGRDEAETKLRRAVSLADQARDDRLRGRAASVLAEVLARAGQLTDALAQRDVAISALARTDDPIGSVALEHAKSVISRFREDAAGERAALRRIVELQVARLGADSAMGMVAGYELGAALHRAGDPEAAAVLERANRTAKRLVKDESLEELIRAAISESDVLKRIALSERALAIIRQEGGFEQLPQALLALALDYEIAGDPGRSLTLLAEAIEILDKLPANQRNPKVLVDSLDTQAAVAFDAAERTDDKARREQLLERSLATLDRLEGIAGKQSMWSALRGRVFLAQRRFADALPLLRTALADAEAEDKPVANRIAIRAFNLAQALWETGGPRDRDRARALVEQAAARFADARKVYETDPNYGAALDTLERRVARLEAWRRAHP